MQGWLGREHGELVLKSLGWLGEEPPGTVQDDNVTAGLVGVVHGAPFCRVHEGTDVARGQVQWINRSPVVHLALDAPVPPPPPPPRVGLGSPGHQVPVPDHTLNRTHEPVTQGRLE